MNNLEQQIQELMLLNQPLQAWNLVKDITSPLKDAVYAKVRHAFEPKEYQKYYAEDLNEVPFPIKWTFGCDRIVPRYTWLIGNLVKIDVKHLLDIGCGTGELGLTLGILEIPSTGLNLNIKSIKYAQDLAKEKNIDKITKFLNIDFFDYTTQHDVVVMFELLEHLTNPVKGLEKAFHLVKPGGSLFLSTPRAGDNEGITRNKWVQKPNSWADGLPSGHLQLFNEDELKTLLKPYNMTQFLTDIMGHFLLEVKKSE